jgi:ribosomal protein S18 acetylase RimI-like enzyme
VATHDGHMAEFDSVTVSEAGPDDVAAIQRFFTEAWTEAGPGAQGWTGADDSVIEELTAPAAILDRIGGPERRMYLAHAEQRVVGFAATRRLDESAVELVGIVVLGTMLGRGIGSKLLAAAARAVSASGCTRMVVRTESENARAIGFYVRSGFLEAGEKVEDVGGNRVRLTELTMDLKVGDDEVDPAPR